MPCTEDIRRTVVEHLIVYMGRQPAGRRLKVPTYRAILNSTNWIGLGLNLRDRHKFGEFMTDRGLCRPLRTHITAHWTTVEKVVASVIRHPPAS